jgi:hypothetical protein
MNLTEEQENIREEIGQKHKPEEMKIIKEIEQIIRTISQTTQEEELKQFKEKLQLLQHQYSMFEAKVTKEFEKAIQPKKKRISPTNQLDLCKHHTISELYFRKQKIIVTETGFIYEQQEYPSLQSITDVYNKANHNVSKINIYTAFTFLKDGCSIKLDTLRSDIPK